MKGLIYRPPSDAHGEFAEWLNALRNQSGAYIIRSRRSHEILYVGESHTGNLAKTLKRHFYAWRDDPERIHHTYDRRAVDEIDGKLAEGAVWRQESIVGSVFEGTYHCVEGGIVPTITGEAFISGEGTLLMDPADPFCWGIRPIAA